MVFVAPIDQTIFQPSTPMTLMKSWERKELVQSLRREGLSYREILARVPFSLSRSTISAWCKDIELSPLQLDRLDRLFLDGSYRGRLVGSKATQARRATEVKAIKAKARAEVPQLAHHRLWLAGLMLYWAEGAKTKHVSVCNSDAALMEVTMRWFREVLRIPESKLRVQLHLHSGQDEHAMKVWWSRVLKIPLTQFGKSYVKPEGTGHRKKILYWGTVRVRVSDTDLLYRILGWIDGITETFRAASSIGSST